MYRESMHNVTVHVSLIPINLNKKKFLGGANGIL